MSKGGQPGQQMQVPQWALQAQQNGAYPLQNGSNFTQKSSTSAPPATYQPMQGYDGKSGAGDDGGVTDAQGNVIPQNGQAAPSAAAPAQSAPAASSTGQYSPWQTQGFIGTPFMQTYGGAPGPYGDDGAQILDSRRMVENGAGRFGSNAASRFGFAPTIWQADTLPYTARGPEAWRAQQASNPALQQPQFNPSVWTGWRGQAPASGPGNPVSGAPGGAAAPAPKAAAPGAGVDHYGNFSQLMKSGDQFGAKRYADMLGTGNANFLQANQGRILQDSFGGDQARMNQWINANSAGGSAWSEKGGNTTLGMDAGLQQMMGGPGAQYTRTDAPAPTKSTRSQAELAAAAAARAKQRGGGYVPGDTTFK